MTTALATLAPRLRKLILLLSSNHDGEVVAAARAIGRTLEQAGSDWHVFADTVSNEKHVSHVKHLDDWRDMANVCRSNVRVLNARERDFVENIARSQRPPSARQMDWLQAICARVRRRAA